MSHAAPENEPAPAVSKPTLPRVARVVIYAVATPIGAAAGVVAASDVGGPVVSLVAGSIAAAATAAVGTTALANLSS